MEVCVITFHDAKNYGAALQAYALIKYLNNQGVNAKIIDLSEEKGRNVGYRQRISEILNSVLYYMHKDELSTLNSRFINFVSEEIPLTRHYNNPDELSDSPPEADLYICGSDQIWNCSSGLRECYFLNFGIAKKISYAASIGVNYIPDGYQKRIKELLQNFEAVSVREESAKELLEPLYNKKCVVSVDPTFLLSRDEWDELIDEPIIKERYLIYYPLHRSKLAINHLEQLKKKLSAKVVTITTSPLPVYGDIVIRNAGPLEFLNLYKYAVYTVNASFHGTVFSIIFEKPFNTQIYGQSGGRVSNLLGKCGLSERIFTDDEYPKDNSENINYKKVKEKIEKNIKNSKKYLLEHIL